MKKNIDIRPGVSVLGVLRHLNYKPWFALSEFVDNSLQSYLSNKNENSFPLEVNIDIDSSPPGSISIRDNAFGIKEEDLDRAFKTACVPLDSSGLSEFGMGMKSAACWFSSTWSVRTTANGEPYVKKINFDVNDIVQDSISEIDIIREGIDSSIHFTEIKLDNIFHTPVKKSITKIKSHLTDIYRDFIRKKLLILKVNGQQLEYIEPKVLSAAFYKDTNQKKIQWIKNIQFDFGNGLSVTGFAALRETGNTSLAGFSLFRRGRVIQGSGDEKYKPYQIFGSSNSFRNQRLFGELHLEGFDVSHTKDGFKWDNNEQPFLDLLKDHLDEQSMPLLQQAEGYRVKSSANKLKVLAEKAVNASSSCLEKNLPDVFMDIVHSGPVNTAVDLPEAKNLLYAKKLKVDFLENKWEIEVEIVDDLSVSDWLTISDSSSITQNPRLVKIRLSLSSKFMINYAHNNIENFEAILKIASSIAIGEIAARDAGVKNAGTVRRNINQILTNIFSDF